MRVDTKTKNAGGHELRARALHTVVAELDLTVTNKWINSDTEQELLTRSSWSIPADSLTQMDFIMTSRQLKIKPVQVLDSDWSKTDHRAVFAVLSLKPKMRYTKRNGANLGARQLLAQCGCRDADGVGELERDGASACGNGEDTQENGNQGVVSDRTRAQIASVEKEENRATTRKVRAELALWKRRALKREKHGKDQGEREMVKAPKKTQSKHFNWSSIAKPESPETVLTNFFQDFYPVPGDQKEATQSERRHWVELWKNLRMDCAGGMLISPKKLEKVMKAHRIRSQQMF